MAQYRESCTLAQRLLQDPQGLKWKEGALMPFLAEGLRCVQRELASNGMQILRGIQELTLTAGTTALSLVSVPALNADFVLPWEIEEKVGGTEGKYQPMTKDEQMLPDRDETPLLQEWNWRGGQIQFVGSTRNVDLRISYEKELTAPSLMTDTIPIIGGASAIAYKAATLAGGKFEDDYQGAVFNLINPEVRANQWRPVRRIPYRYR